MTVGVLTNGFRTAWRQNWQPCIETQEAAVLSHVEAVGSTAGFAPRVERLRVAMVGWLEAHWQALAVTAGVTLAVALLATAAVPPLLAPFVLGPLGAVVMTALIGPRERTARRTDTARGRVRRST